LASSYEIRAVDARGVNLLSKRELEVVRGVALGMSNREIAGRLHLSQHTIKNCLFRVFDKLGVSSRVELLFMTLSREKDTQSAVTHFLSDRAYENLHDEGTLAACESAAKQGVLTAQIALAQYHSNCNADPNSAARAFEWYTVATERISRGCRELAKKLTIQQVVEAEEMAAEHLKGSRDAGALSPKPQVARASAELARNTRAVGNHARAAKSSA